MQRQQLCSLETEVENYKKNITKEQERNEELTMMVNKVEADIAHAKRQIEASEAKLEVLKTEYTTYTRTLQETEQSLAKATTVSKDAIVILCWIENYLLNLHWPHLVFIANLIVKYDYSSLIYTCISSLLVYSVHTLRGSTKV